jgi:protein TonB
MLTGVAQVSSGKKPALKAESKAPVYSVVEQMPEFPGGAGALVKFMNTYVTYPEDAKKAKIKGTVYVSFVVRQDGTVQDVEVSKGLSPSCDREALTSISIMPKWKAGRQGGKPVNVQMMVPVRFGLE